MCLEVELLHHCFIQSFSASPIRWNLGKRRKNHRLISCFHDTHTPTLTRHADFCLRLRVFNTPYFSCLESALAWETSMEPKPDQEIIWDWLKATSTSWLDSSSWGEADPLPVKPTWAIALGDWLWPRTRVQQWPLLFCVRANQGCGSCPKESERMWPSSLSLPYYKPRDLANIL